MATSTERPPLQEEQLAAATDRLRKSLQGRIDHAWDEGQSKGREWALEIAEGSELERLAGWAEGMTNCDLAQIMAQHGMHALYTAVTGRERCPMRDVFWWESIARQSGIGGEGNWAHGFVAGALEVWHQVKERL